ncbi:MAG TPA: enoyl-CoA hydratase/isomerase family protein [Acidimicrobiales bacterium]|jgi:enoyl-CoA hydratase/carnithine racemase|nr:enoyl-CoA hydratase/isomerase family protein [Acidimicrobiales bacterium]
MTGKVRLDVDGAIAVITNDNADKHNAFDDDMDLQLFEILGQLVRRPDVRAVVWRGEGKSFSSGRDVAAIGVPQDQAVLTHHELMTRGHRGIQQVFDLEAPIIVACKGWTMGGSFQRALLCDIRIAAEDARFMLPEVTHGVIPDTGGVGRLFQICGHGVASDMVLTGRTMHADEALAHGIVSRVMPLEDLDRVAMEMAHKIAAAPAVTVKMARRVVKHLSEPAIYASMAEELVAQTFVSRSDDMAELRAARAAGRDPVYTGS